jgi:hypothetical protein
MNNTQLTVVLVFWVMILFCAEAFIEGTNLQTIIETCKESK